MSAPSTIGSELHRAVIDHRDAELLLAHVLGSERVTVVAHPEQRMTTNEQRRFRSLVEQRQQGEPLAYLLGTQPFFGLEFTVSKRVLIPRPETEYLVEYGIRLLSQRHDIGAILDVGTGSGAILVSVLSHLSPTRRRSIHAVGTDISRSALAIARKNAARHNVKKVSWKNSNLLRSVRLPRKPFLLLANLPYGTTADYEAVSPEVRREPKRAIVAGSDGLKYYRPLLKHLSHFPTAWFAIFEIDPCHAKEIQNIATKYLHNHRAKIQKDFSHLDRYLILEPKQKRPR